MKYTEFIILDIETTGVDPSTGDIIEFAGVRIDSTGKVIDRLDMLIGTHQEVNTFVRALTGIDPSDLEGKPHIEAVLPEIVKFIGDAPIVGHNISFDVDFLNGKGANLENPLLDTVELAQTVLPRQDGYSLEYLACYFNFPNQSSHRAMADVMATVDLFYLLVSTVQTLPEKTRAYIVSLLSKTTWSWLWLFAEKYDFVVPVFTPVKTSVTEKLLADIKKSDSNYLAKLTAASQDHTAFLEQHFAADPLAVALSYAAAHKPAILCVSNNNLKVANWAELGAGLGINIASGDLANLSYKPGSEEELVASLPTVSTIEARLIAKAAIWRDVWGMDYGKLFLTSDERYQWEQKFTAGDDAQTDTTNPDILVVSPQGLLGLTDTTGSSLVITDPLSLEDAAFHNSGRVFSVPYFNALVSSRRDFVHMNIREQDSKTADQLFKLLNDIGVNLTQLAQQFIAIFTAYPPSSPFDRNLELVAGHITEPTSKALTELVKDLQSYLDILQAIKVEDADKQIKSTTKLLSHLKSLSQMSPEYRYFLWADGHRFFLELVPRTPDFANLGELVSQAKQVRVIGPGLTYTGNFAYWQTAFPGSVGVILPGDASAEINVLTNLADDDQYSHDLAQVAESFIAKHAKSLVLAGSNFDGGQLFEALYDRAKGHGITVDSQDTLKAVENLPGHYNAHNHAAMVGNFWWLEKARFFLDDPSEILLGKVPFEASSRPQAKVMQGDFNGFESYTLPRTVMKFKDTLHYLVLTKKPLTLADSRLYRKDYGRKIINSCPGVTFIPN